MTAAALKRVVLGVVVAGCAWASVSARAATIQIVIDRAAFQQAEITVNVGDRVEWVNKDIVDHTATARTKDTFDVAIPAGKKAGLVLKKAGTFDYYCKLHPNMTARLIVKKPK
jgi:plastocyanin